MYPQLTVLVFAIIGAFLNGVIGFFLGGIFGIIAVAIIGIIYGYFQGGFIPRRVRVETARDFITSYPDLVQMTYRDTTAKLIQKNIEELLELMVAEANRQISSIELDRLTDPQVFMPAAMSVIVNQVIDEEKELAENLLMFLMSHKSWYGNDLY